MTFWPINQSTFHWSTRPDQSGHTILAEQIEANKAHQWKCLQQRQRLLQMATWKCRECVPAEDRSVFRRLAKIKIPLRPPPRRRLHPQWAQGDQQHWKQLDAAGCSFLLFWNRKERGRKQDCHLHYRWEGAVNIHLHTTYTENTLNVKILLKTTMIQPVCWHRMCGRRSKSVISMAQSVGWSVSQR